MSDGLYDYEFEYSGIDPLSESAWTACARWEDEGGNEWIQEGRIAESKQDLGFDIDEDEDELRRMFDDSGEEYFFLGIDQPEQIGSSSNESLSLPISHISSSKLPLGSMLGSIGAVPPAVMRPDESKKRNHSSRIIHHEDGGMTIHVPEVECIPDFDPDAIRIELNGQVIYDARNSKRRKREEEVRQPSLILRINRSLINDID